MSNIMPQHGGKYADHEFVKVASKVIKGVERAPYNKFETVLVNYDKMKDIKEKRNLTKSEQRIYDKTDTLIQKEFDAMFKKADTMLDKLDQTTTAQQGGAPPDAKKAVADDAAIRRMIKDATGKETGVSQEVPAEAAIEVTKEVPAANTTATSDAPAAAAAAAVNPDAVDAAAAAVNPDADAAAAATPVKDSDAVAAAAAAAAGPKKKPGEKDTRYLDSNRFYRWIVSLLEGIWTWIKDLFTEAFNEKFEALRKQFSADELFKLFGPNPEKKIEKATGVFQEQAEKLQRLVATGIGGAASASIDMILNAFSMSPVFGTTILVWRMFQNMLMIMGASLSVQAASNSTATTLATLADSKADAGQDGGNAKAKNNVTKRLKTDIRQLNRSLKRYMHFPHIRKTVTMSGGLGSGYSYT